MCLLLINEVFLVKTQGWHVLSDSDVEALVRKLIHMACNIVTTMGVRSSLFWDVTQYRF